MYVFRKLELIWRDLHGEDKKIIKKFEAGDNISIKVSDTEDNYKRAIIDSISPFRVRLYDGTIKSVYYENIEGFDILNMEYDIDGQYVLVQDNKIFKIGDWVLVSIPLKGIDRVLYKIEDIAPVFTTNTMIIKFKDIVVMTIGSYMDQIYYYDYRTDLIYDKYVLLHDGMICNFDTVYLEEV